MRKTIRYLFLTLALGPVAPPLSAGDPYQRPATVNYARPFEPPVRSAFIPLPPGKVQPRGWIRDWCILARDGMTGHLDELDPSGESKVCWQQGWTPDKTAIPEMTVRDPKDFFPYPVNDNEVLPYWSDGMIRLAYVLNDDFLLRRAKKHFDRIVNKENKDSLLFMWWINRNDRQFLKHLGKEAQKLFVEADDVSCSVQWSSSLVGDGLATYYAASGDRRSAAGIGNCLQRRTPLDGRIELLGQRLSGLRDVYLERQPGNPRNPRRLVPEMRNRDAPRRGHVPGSEKFPTQVRHSVCMYEKTGPWPIGYLWTRARSFFDTPRCWLDLVDTLDAALWRERERRISRTFRRSSAAPNRAISCI